MKKLLALGLALLFAALPAIAATTPTLQSGGAVAPADLFITRQGANNADSKITATGLRDFMTGAGYVRPEEYGALGNGKTIFDGAFTNTAGTVATTVNTVSTTPTTPVAATVTANAQQLSIFVTSDAWTSAPSTGTTRVNLAWAGGKYGMFLSDQLIASPGATSSVSGTIAGSWDWSAATINLAPSGGSVTYVANNTYQNSGSVTATITKPTGTTTNDYMVACIGYFSYTGMSVKTPAGWYLITSRATRNGGNVNLSCFGKVATASEPANYAFVVNPSAILSGFIATYRNTSGPDSPTYALSSATAAFTAADVGKLICVAGTGGGPGYEGQQCGTIAAYNSATSVNTSFPVWKSLTDLQFSYGTNDDAAFSSMMTTAPCSTVGCEIQLDAKHYMLTAPLKFPVNQPIAMDGVAPGVPNTANSYLNGNTLPNKTSGTKLQFMSQNMTGTAAILVGGTANVTSGTSPVVISDLSIYGGAGIGRDGGGVNGVNILNWQHAVLENVYVFNFSGIGVYIDGVQANNYKDYIENILLDHVVLSWNQTSGLKVGSTTNVYNIENVGCNFCIIEASGGPAIHLAGANIQGFDLANSTIQWNNINTANPEVLVSGTVIGGLIRTTYFEYDGNLSSQSNGIIGNSVSGRTSAGLIGLKVDRSNYFLPANGWVPMVFSAAGTAVPTCSASNSATNLAQVNVSDATACTAGTTYTSGGSARCVLQCSGGSWLATGAAAYN